MEDSGIKPQGNLCVARQYEVVVSYLKI